MTLIDIFLLKVLITSMAYKCNLFSLLEDLKDVCVLSRFRCVRFFATLWSVAHQPPPQSTRSQLPILYCLLQQPGGSASHHATPCPLFPVSFLLLLESDVFSPLLHCQFSCPWVKLVKALLCLLLFFLPSLL